MSSGRSSVTCARCYGSPKGAKRARGPDLVIDARERRPRRAQISEHARHAQAEAGETAEIAYIGIRHFDVKERCKGTRLKVITGFRKERFESLEW